MDLQLVEISLPVTDTFKHLHNRLRPRKKNLQSWPAQDCPKLLSHCPNIRKEVQPLKLPGEDAKHLVQNVVCVSFNVVQQGC